MAQSPFSDYFNHTSSPSACNVLFSSSGYTITTPAKIKQGEEVYISYGNHSNDFLLTEYGFILPEEGAEISGTRSRSMPSSCFFSLQSKKGG